MRVLSGPELLLAGGKEKCQREGCEHKAASYTEEGESYVLLCEEHMPPPWSWNMTGMTHVTMVSGSKPPWGASFAARTCLPGQVDARNQFQVTGLTGHGGKVEVRKW